MYIININTISSQVISSWRCRSIISILDKKKNSNVIIKYKVWIVNIYGFNNVELIIFCVIIFEISSSHINRACSSNLEIRILFLKKNIKFCLLEKIISEI